MNKQEIRQDLIKQLRSILEEVDQLEVSKDSEPWKDSACNHLHEVTGFIAYQFGLCSECLTPTSKNRLKENVLNDGSTYCDDCYQAIE